MGEGARQKRRVSRTRVMVFLVLMLVYSLTPMGTQFWQRLFADCGFTQSAGSASPDLFRIHALDVGKADALLLESQGRLALLDAGTFAEGEKVADYIFRLGFDHLDYIIASHPDSDHIGGVLQVLKEIPTGAFLRAEGWEDAGQEARDVLEYLEENGIPQQTLYPGGSFTLGCARLDVLGPLFSYPDTNNNSLVLKLTCFQFTALFCGDIEKEAEADLLRSGQDLSANLLKVAHHGSRTSSTEEFLQAVSPQLAVVSVGPDNNDLPRPETLARLEAAGARILRTDLDGNTVISYNGERIGVQAGAK